MNSRRMAVIRRNEISRLCTFRLGGYDQKVLIEGRSKKLPVVVTLHGGPGTPVPFSVGCRGLFPEFTDRFIMVYWDQLGCGINNYEIDGHFRIANFVDMTAELLREIRAMFPDNRIVLFATSWGSILGAGALEQADGLVDAAVVCGQIIKNVFLSDEIFDALKKSALPRKQLDEITNIRIENLSEKDMRLLAKSLRKYTDAYMNKNTKRAPMGPVVWGLLRSPDYRLRDFKAVAVNGYRNSISLWKEILKVDLSETLAGVRIPYLMLQGDTDLVASTRTAKTLAEQSGNPNLRCRIVANTGHMPGEDMMEAVLRGLVECSR